MLSSISSSSPSYHNTYQFSHQNNKPVDKQDDLHQEATAELAHSETENPKSEDYQKQQEVQKLKARDQEVRAHEQAHLGAAGGLATSGASFSYQKGSDGVNYAVGGEVSIDTTAVSGDPEATIKKAETIKRAALAPASPSSQDIKVASQATAMANKARAELFQNNQNIPDDNDASGNRISLSA